MIKNIIFDMGRVLINWNPTAMMKEKGLSDEDIAILKEKAFDNFKWTLIDAGFYDTEESFLQDICRTLPEHLHKPLREIVLDFGHDEVESIPGMPELVKTLKDNGYKIYLLSNAGPNHPNYWKNVKGHEYFDGLVVSAQVKMFKPERQIFNYTLEKFNIKADESVFIDDVPINCTGAWLCGIHAINFKNHEQCVKELVELGVNCS